MVEALFSPCIGSSVPGVQVSQGPEAQAAHAGVLAHHRVAVSVGSRIGFSASPVRTTVAVTVTGL